MRPKLAPSYKIIGLVTLAAALSIGNATSLAAPINLGAAADYAVVGVGGDVNVTSDFQIYQSGTVINGNVAQGPRTNLTHGIDARVNGRWDYDLTDSAPFLGSGGVVTGGFHQMDLSGVAAAARAAAAQGMTYASTQVYSSLTSGQTIMGNGGLNVIQVTGNTAISGGGTTFTLQGTATDMFVFQFTSSATAGHDVLTLSGVTMNITGINPNNIFWVFHGDGGDITIKAGATVYGNFLAPDRNITSDHGNVLGRLIGGGSLYGARLLSIHSGSQITAPTSIPVPDNGSTLSLLGLALLGLFGLNAKRIRAKWPSLSIRDP